MRSGPYDTNSKHGRIASTLKKDSQDIESVIVSDIPNMQTETVMENTENYKY